jgi:hypothetical protein
LIGKLVQREIVFDIIAVFRKVAPLLRSG